MIPTTPPSIRLNGEAVTDSIPGLKTSAAFFSSLSTNLRLGEISPLPSPAPSPSILPMNANTIEADYPLHALSPLIFASSLSRSSSKYTAELQGVPDYDLVKEEEEPSIYLTEDTTERAAAVRLVSDSVAQQQTFAASTLLSHPLNVFLFALLLVIASRITHGLCHGPASPQKKLAPEHISTAVFLAAARPSLPAFIVWMVLGAIALLSAYILTLPYQGLASFVNVNDWLHGGDDVVVATSGADGRILGTIVVGWTVCVREAGKGGARKKRIGRAWVKGWTVHSSFRRHGLGTALLSEAVALVNRRCGTEGGICFAKDHAHSQRVLPAFYNRSFDRRDRRAAQHLRCAVENVKDRRR